HLAREKQVPFAVDRGPLNEDAEVGAAAVALPTPPTQETKRAAKVRPDLLLVTCVKTKQQKPAEAKDLYTAPLFRRQLAYAPARWRTVVYLVGRARPRGTGRVVGAVRTLPSGHAAHIPQSMGLVGGG